MDGTASAILMLSVLELSGRTLVGATPRGFVVFARAFVGLWRMLGP